MKILDPSVNRVDHSTIQLIAKWKFWILVQIM